MSIKEVPSPIDLRQREDAREWARTALEKRPDRPLFFDRFSEEIARHGNVSKILELGSGPGFLAFHILDRFDNIDYVALDFSPAMHELARQRLVGKNVTYLERDFKTHHWNEGIGTFDCVVTNQAVHELRHKSYATAFHQQVLQILSDDAVYLVNDHFAGDDGMSNSELFMTNEEQQAALHEAGFSEVSELLRQSKMSLLRAMK